MQNTNDEKPANTTDVVDEAPARNLVSTVLNAVSKQNRGLQTDSNSPMVLLQQQANQLNAITGTATPPTSIAGAD